MKLVLKDGTKIEISTATRDVYKKGGDNPYLIYLTLEDPMVTPEELGECLTKENLSEITIEALSGSMKRIGCELNDLTAHLNDTHSSININLTAGSAAGA